MSQLISPVQERDASGLYEFPRGKGYFLQQLVSDLKVSHREVAFPVYSLPI